MGVSALKSRPMKTKSVLSGSGLFYGSLMFMDVEVLEKLFLSPVLGSISRVLSVTHISNTPSIP